MGKALDTISKLNAVTFDWKDTDEHDLGLIAEDVAKVISVLCQNGAEWISGGIINADGGEDQVSYVGQGEPTEL